MLRTSRLMTIRVYLYLTRESVIPAAPYNPPSPYSPPFHPYVGDPVFPSQPQVWYTTTDAGGKQTLNDNLTNK